MTYKFEMFTINYYRPVGNVFEKIGEAISDIMKMDARKPGSAPPFVIWLKKDEISYVVGYDITKTENDTAWKITVFAEIIDIADACLARIHFPEDYILEEMV